MSHFRRPHRVFKRRGASLIEYIGIAFLLAGVAFVTFPNLATQVKKLYGTYGSASSGGISSTSPTSSSGSSSGGSTISGSDTTTPTSQPQLQGEWYGNPDLGMDIAKNWVTPENPSSRQETLTFLNQGASEMNNIHPFVEDNSTKNISTHLLSTTCDGVLQGWGTCTATVEVTASMNGTSQATLYATSDGQYPQQIGGVISAYTRPYIPEIVQQPGSGPTPVYTFPIGAPMDQGLHVITIANDLKEIRVDGTLPNGISFLGADSISSTTTQNSIAFSGTPTLAGTWTFNVVMLTRSELATTQPITITITGSNKLEWGSGTTSASVGRYYAQTAYYLSLFNPNAAPYNGVSPVVSGDGYSLESSCSSIPANHGYCGVVVAFHAPKESNGVYQGVVSLGQGQPSLTLSTTVTGY